MSKNFQNKLDFSYNPGHDCFIYKEAFFDNEINKNSSKTASFFSKSHPNEIQGSFYEISKEQ